jgi:hypothetical protein
MGYSIGLSFLFALGPVTGSALYGKNLSASLGVVGLLQAEVLFDAIHETGAQFLLLAVHRKNRHLRAESNNEMAAVSRLECAALLLQPSLEFLTRHIITNGGYNSCVALSTDVLPGTLAVRGCSSESGAVSELAVRLLMTLMNWAFFLSY